VNTKEESFFMFKNILLISLFSTVSILSCSHLEKKEPTIRSIAGNDDTSLSYKVEKSCEQDIYTENYYVVLSQINTNPVTSIIFKNNHFTLSFLKLEDCQNELKKLSEKKTEPHLMCACGSIVREDWRQYYNELWYFSSLECVAFSSANKISNANKEYIRMSNYDKLSQDERNKLPMSAFYDYDKGGNTYTYCKIKADNLEKTIKRLGH
jgi:hypothetical protein